MGSDEVFVDTLNLQLYKNIWPKHISGELRIGG